MIIKNADNKDPAIATLESLLAGADSKKQKLVTDELRMMGRTVEKSIMGITLRRDL